MSAPDRLKYYSSLKQKKNREKENKFLIEGVHLIEEALKSDFHIEIVFVCEPMLSSRPQDMFDIISDKKIQLQFLKSNQFLKLSETEHSPGIIAVVQVKPHSDNDYQNSKLIVALDGINDPGNLGSVIRSCHWFGVDNLLIGKNSVNLYNSKVVRSTQGSLFHLNISDNLDLSNELSRLQTLGYNIVLFDVSSNEELNNNHINLKNVLVFGSEIGGISDKLLKSEFKRVKIKGYSDCDSLNLGVSCGIALNFFKSKS